MSGCSSAAYLRRLRGVVEYGTIHAEVLLIDRKRRFGCEKGDLLDIGLIEGKFGIRPFSVLLNSICDSDPGIVLIKYVLHGDLSEHRGSPI